MALINYSTQIQFDHGAGLPMRCAAAIGASACLPGSARWAIRSEDFPGVISNALKDHCHATNPTQASAEDYRPMLEASF